MPMENMVHMFGGGKKKSTLIDEKIIEEDDAAPRQMILNKFCPDENSAFRKCMVENGQNEASCLQSKGHLDVCSKAAFKKVNSDPSFIF